MDAIIFLLFSDILSAVIFYVSVQAIVLILNYDFHIPKKQDFHGSPQVLKFKLKFDVSELVTMNILLICVQPFFFFEQY